MKAEERHELKENDLMSWLRYGLPIWLKNNGSYVLLVLALGFLGWRLWSMYEQKQADALERAWTELGAVNPRMAIFMASADPKSDPGTASKLIGIIDSADSKAVKAEALLELGDFYLLNVAFDNNTTGSDRRETLSKADAVYNRVLKEVGDDTRVAGMAYLGLAAVAEDRADWDVARKQYEVLADKNGRFAGTPFNELGAGMLAKLEDRRNAPALAAYVVPPRPAASSSTPEWMRPAGPPGGAALPGGTPAMTLPGAWQLPTQMGPPATFKGPPIGPAPSFTLPPTPTSAPATPTLPASEPAPGK